ncbi:WhiB family transcriptional regulator [Rhodococcus erythropolis]
MRDLPLDLPAPRIEAWDWQVRASCRSRDVNLFFEEVEGSPEEQEAKQICSHCKVIQQCRDYAITANEPHGVWGGLLPHERRQHRWLYYRPAFREHTVI